MDELAAALAFDRAIRLKGATVHVALPDGAVVLDSRTPNVYHLNSVLLDKPLARWVNADAIERLADEWLGHLKHRRVVLDDAAAAQRLEPDMLRAGWGRQRTLFMAWRGPRHPGPGSDDPRVREIEEPELRRLQLGLFAEDRGFPDAAVDSLNEALVAAQDALRAATRARAFGAGEDGRLDSSCTLFLERAPGDGGVAMIDEVGTRIAQRERGLARAVVRRAIDAAIEEGCDPIVIPADADDWPQLIYVKLGFEPVGMQVTFTKTI